MWGSAFATWKGSSREVASLFYDPNHDWKNQAHDARVFNKVSVKATCWQPGLNCRHGGSLIGNPVGIITSLDLDLKPSSHKLPWLFKLQHYFFSQSTFAFGKSRKTKENPGKSFYVCTVGSFLSPKIAIFSHYTKSPYFVQFQNFWQEKMSKSTY